MWVRNPTFHTSQTPDTWLVPSINNYSNLSVCNQVYFSDFRKNDREALICLGLFIPLEVKKLRRGIYTLQGKGIVVIPGSLGINWMLYHIRKHKTCDMSRQQYNSQSSVDNRIYFSKIYMHLLYIQIQIEQIYIKERTNYSQVSNSN